MQKKIIHIDMDAFYSSVEELDDPTLSGKPVVVGGPPNSRGVVCTANYIARKFGVRSAMPCRQAYQLCPDALFIAPRFQRYQEISRKIMDIFKSVTPLVQPLSLDEAYLDVTKNSLDEKSAKNVAVFIKQRIKEKIGLTASAGIGPNKLIAKIASDLQKPNGLVVISPEEALAFLAPLPVRKIGGVGPVTEAKLHKHGLKLISDIRKSSPEKLAQQLGKFGLELYNLSFGRDNREVVPYRRAKSIGTEQTFAEDVYDEQYLKSILTDQCHEIYEKVQRKDVTPRTLSLKFRYSDFTTLTRSKTFPNGLIELEDYILTSHDLYTHINLKLKPIRLIGLSAQNFKYEDGPEQLELAFP